MTYIVLERVASITTPKFLVNMNFFQVYRSAVSDVTSRDIVSYVIPSLGHSACSSSVRRLAAAAAERNALAATNRRGWSADCAVDGRRMRPCT